MRVLQVPFKGGPETMTALLSGLVDFTFAPIPLALPHVRSGRLRLLAVTSPQRSTIFPDMPTVAAQGLAGYEVSAWYGLAAPCHQHAQFPYRGCPCVARRPRETRRPGHGSGATEELKFYARLVADANIEKMQGVRSRRHARRAGCNRRCCPSGCEVPPSPEYLACNYHHLINECFI